MAGEYSYVSNTVVFPKVGQTARTDELFRANQYPDHQKIDTPLSRLPIDMVKDIIVADPLHLLELGVIKRLLIGWRTGNLGYVAKWTARQQEEISDLLLKITMPSEVHRDARTLKLFGYWKGLEFRNFLNYYGVIVLSKYLPEKCYEHFLKLFCAVTICSVKKHLCHLNVAQILFQSFISDYKRIYGNEFLTSNVHNLDHVVDDVARFGVLYSISAYPFENSLYTLKRMLRQGKQPLVQIVNRLTERLFISDFNYKSGDDKEPVIRVSELFCEIKLPEFKLTNAKFKDKWFGANDKIVCITNAYEEGSNYFIEGYAANSQNNVFDTPFASSLLNIYKADIDNINRGELLRVNVCDINCKFVAIHMRESTYAFIPLQHTMK